MSTPLGGFSLDDLLDFANQSDPSPVAPEWWEPLDGTYPRDLTDLEEAIREDERRRRIEEEAEELARMKGDSPVVLQAHGRREVYRSVKELNEALAKMDEEFRAVSKVMKSFAEHIPPPPNAPTHGPNVPKDRITYPTSHDTKKKWRRR